MVKEVLSKIDATELNLNDRLIYINRVAKVLKGGKRLSFSALTVTGDGQGYVGLGVGKANEVPEAINKANAAARKNLIKVPIAGATIPHRILIKYGAAEILLKPASPGTGIIAGGSARPVLEAAGIKDIIAKSLGRSNRYNLAKATLLALSELKDPKAEVAKRKQVPEVAAEPAKGEETATDG